MLLNMALQLGPDDRIYTWTGDLGTAALSVIRYPNEAGQSCDHDHLITRDINTNASILGSPPDHTVFMATVRRVLAFPAAAGELSTKDRLERDGLVRRYAFEQNGVFLHETFFEALGGGRGSPAANGAFSDAVDISYGGFDTWKQDVVELGKTRGVGWVITCRSRSENRLLNVWVDDHTRGLIPGFDPVVAFDLWEHAYLLDFKPSRRPDYLQVLFDNMNWDVVESRCV